MMMSKDLFFIINKKIFLLIKIIFANNVNIFHVSILVKLTKFCEFLGKGFGVLPWSMTDFSHSGCDSLQLNLEGSSVVSLLGPHFGMPLVFMATELWNNFFPSWMETPSNNLLPPNR